MSPPLLTIPISSSPGRPKERQTHPLPSQELSEKLRKGTAAMCGTNHTTRISRPVRPACPAPGSRRGRSVAEKRGSEPALPSQLSWVSGCSVPRRCQECRESLLAGTTVGRLLAALWRGSSALSCSRWEQHQPELCCRWLRGTHQVPDTRPRH